jgi:hypothetical protein
MVDTIHHKTHQHPALHKASHSHNHHSTPRNLAAVKPTDTQSHRIGHWSIHFSSNQCTQSLLLNHAESAKDVGIQQGRRIQEEGLQVQRSTTKQLASAIRLHLHHHPSSTTSRTMLIFQANFPPAHQGMKSLRSPKTGSCMARRRAKVRG